MKPKTYEKIIEILVEKLGLAEWRLERAEEENRRLMKENQALRSEK